MTSDERAIRDLITAWMTASQSGDLETVLSLMTDDALFMVPGREPFGKRAFAALSQGFAALSQGMENVRMQGTSDIREVKVLGDWAYLRSYVTVTMTRPDGAQEITYNNYIGQTPLTDLASVHRDAESGRTRGKIILVP